MKIYSFERTMSEHLVKPWMTDLSHLTNGELVNKHHCTHWFVDLVSRNEIESEMYNSNALIIAAMEGYQDVFDYLLGLPGTNPMIFDNAAIRVAARNGRLPMVEVLASLPEVNPDAKIDKIHKLGLWGDYQSNGLHRNRGLCPFTWTKP